jgi:hypothetical protein
VGELADLAAVQRQVALALTTDVPPPAWLSAVEVARARAILGRKRNEHVARQTAASPPPPDHPGSPGDEPPSRAASADDGSSVPCTCTAAGQPTNGAPTTASASMRQCASPLPQYLARGVR